MARGTTDQPGTGQGGKHSSLPHVPSCQADLNVTVPTSEGRVGPPGGRDWGPGLCFPASVDKEAVRGDMPCKAGWGPSPRAPRQGECPFPLSLLSQLFPNGGQSPILPSACMLRLCHFWLKPILLDPQLPSQVHSDSTVAVESYRQAASPSPAHWQRLCSFNG